MSGWGKNTEAECMECPGLGGRNIIKIDLHEIKWGTCGLYFRYSERDGSQAVVSKVMKFRLP